MSAMFNSDDEGLAGPDETIGASGDLLADGDQEDDHHHHNGSSSDVRLPASSSGGDQCCDVGRRFQALQQNPTSPPILIVGTEKMTEMGQSFIVYCIQLPGASTDGPVVKRRYSEFESMRKLLKRLYAHVIVPPIPEKHSIADYAKMQGKARDDPHIIELRKRMLQSFLNRTAGHALLGRDHLFHRFFEPGSWSDVLFSQKVGRREQARPVSPVSTAAMLPMALKKLKNPDLKFLDIEQYSEKLSERFGFLERDSKKLGRVLSDMADLHGELGAIVNAFSLHETRNTSLGEGIEQVGQVMDASCASTGALAKDLEAAWTEHVHEYHQIVATMQSVLKHRHQKHLHYEDLGDQLDNKRIYLATLERDPTSPNAGTYVAPVGSASSNPITGLGKMMINGIGTIGDKIHSVMDNNPESTRRAQAAKCRDQIAQLEKLREEAHVELGKFSDLVLQDLERFHARKSRDFRQLLLTFAHIHKQWVEKNIRALEAAQTVVARIKV